VPLKVFTSINSDCSEQVDMTELTPIMNSVHTSNDSLQRQRELLSVDTIIENDCSEHGDMTELTPILTVCTSKMTACRDDACLSAWLPA
jgi:hypothetical protein